MRTTGRKLEARLKDIVVGRNENLPLSAVDGFPVLKDVLDWWHRAGTGGVPRAVDPTDLPRKALPHLMLVDLVGTEDAVIRLAGTLPCDLYGRELKGTSVHAFFEREGAVQVLKDLNAVADSGTPSLTLRSYVALNGKFWSYARLVLPIYPDGERATRILKALEPGSFREVGTA